MKSQIDHSSLDRILELLNQAKRGTLEHYMIATLSQEYKNYLLAVDHSQTSWETFTSMRSHEYWQVKASPTAFNTEDLDTLKTRCFYDKNLSEIEVYAFAKKIVSLRNEIVNYNASIQKKNSRLSA